MRIPDSGLIELTGMKFHSYHGCLPEERILGNEFIVDFKYKYPIAKAAQSDKIEDTLDYGAIYDIVAEQMDVRANLLENVAGRIFEAVEKAFPQLEEFEVKVTKKNPPVEGVAESASITLRK